MTTTTASPTRTSVALDRARQIAATADAALRLFGDGPVEHRFTVRGRPVRLQNRGPAAHMGRFGGGWETELGIQLGRRGLAGTIIVNLGRGSVRIDPRKASQ